MMNRRLNWMIVIVAGLLLTGCFRQAGPDVQRPNNVITTPTAFVAPPDTATGTPFITPFTPGEGPDLDTMPTFAGPSPTLALVEPGVTNAAPGAGTDAGILPAQSPIPGPTSTVPFAAGPTYTPRAGEPPVNLNPNPSTSTPVPGQAGVDSGSGDSASDECVYVVQAGDSAFFIATQFGVTLNELASFNNLEDPDRLFEGQELQIPNCGDNALPATLPPESTSVIQPPPPTPTSILPPAVDGEGNTIHVVAAGENLFRISLQYGVTVEAIKAANGLLDDNIQPGQELVIPAP